MNTKNNETALIASLDDAELDGVVGGYAQTVGDILNGMPWPGPCFPFPNPNDPDAPAPNTF